MKDVSTDTYIGLQTCYSPIIEQKGGTSTVSYIKVAPVKPTSTVAGAKTPFWRFYYKNTGINNAILGSPALDTDSVLSNCVGFAQGRFGQICSEVGALPLTYNAAAGFSGTIASAVNMTCTPDCTDKVSDEYYIRKIQPGTLITYVNTTNSSYIHVVVVEKILERDSTGKPTKLCVSAGHYGTEKYVTTETVALNGGKWTIGNYVASGYIFNPAVRAFTFPGNTYGTLGSVSANTKLAVALGSISSSDISVGVSFNIKFKTPGTLADRFMIFGNYTDSSNSAINIEIKNKKPRVYIYNSVNKALFDDVLNYELSTNTEYVFKLTIVNNNFYFGILNAPCDFYSGSVNLTGASFSNFAFFKDNRTAASTFTNHVSIEYCSIYRKLSPLAYFVPVSTKNGLECGVYDLCSGIASTSQDIYGVTGSIDYVGSSTTSSDTTALKTQVSDLTAQVSSLTTANTELTSKYNTLNSKYESVRTSINKAAEDLGNIADKM